MAESKIDQDKKNDIYKFIDRITDEKSFVEVDALIRDETCFGTAYGEGVASGFASINNVQVGIFATNPEVLKGSIGKRNAQKIAKCINNAVKTNSPLIAVLDTSGARFSEGIEAMEGYGLILRCFSRAYDYIPTICVLKGNNFGMLSYLTAYCDLCIAYDKAVLSTASPLILASKTKYDASFIGTASIHSQQSGLISNIVKNDEELRTKLYKFVDLLGQPRKMSADDPNRICRGLNSDSKAYDIIKEAFDKDSFYEMREFYSREFVTGYARLDGYTVGIIASNYNVNEGKLSADAATKITEIVTSCEKFNIPIIAIVDSEGVRKNLESENTNLIWDIGSMIYGLSHSSATKVALISGKAVGLAYVALASKSIYDYTIAWDSAKISMIDSLAASTLVYADDLAKAKDKGEKDELTKKFDEAYTEENCRASVIAQKGYIDNVIKPCFSRQYLIAGVEMFYDKR